MNPSVILAIIGMVPEAITDVEKIIESPGVQDLLSIFEKYFVHTTTPGGVVVVEPKVTVTSAPKGN